VPPRIPQRVQHHAEDAAVRRHPPFPDAEENQRVAQESAEIVEQHVAEPAAEEHAEDGATRDEIADFAGRDDGKPAPGQMAIDEVSRGKRREISQPIPAHPEPVAELHGKGIEVVHPGGDHSAADCGTLRKRDGS
jgi:hypothetical protein